MAQAIRRGASVKGGLLGSALVIAGMLAVTTMPPLGSTREDRAAATVLASRDILFADRSDGGVVVTDALTRLQVATLEPGEDGFVRGAMRGLVRGRRLGGVGDETPFRLTGWSDGRLTLEDPTTRTRLDMAAYGQTNVESFARFLPTMENQR